jgi:hypothetical protein
MFHLISFILESYRLSNYLSLISHALFIIQINPFTKALCYKPEGCRLDEVNGFFFSVYLILPAALGPGVYSASKTNEYRKQENNVSGE